IQYFAIAIFLRSIRLNFENRILSHFYFVSGMKHRMGISLIAILVKEITKELFFSFMDLKGIPPVPTCKGWQGICIPIIGMSSLSITEDAAVNQIDWKEHIMREISTMRDLL